MWQCETFKKIEQVPREDRVLPGNALCAGCGGLESLRGLWPLQEAVNGVVTHTYVPKRKPIAA